METLRSAKTMCRALGIQGSFLDEIYAQEGYEGQFPRITVAGFGNNGMTHGSATSNNVEWSSREIAERSRSSEATTP